MNTKEKGDIAEQAAVLAALRRGWHVLNPIGDRLSYDLVFEINGIFVPIQVKAAWFDQQRKNYVIDTRRTKTNRRRMVRDRYTVADFAFALIYIADIDIFYILPVKEFISYGSEIHMVESHKRQRKPRSSDFREAWDLIEQWAISVETLR